MGAISGAGISYPSGPAKLPPVLSGFVLLDLLFYVYVFLDLRFMDSFLLPLSSNSSSYTCKQ
jgi:hypothetical protein